MSKQTRKWLTGTITLLLLTISIISTPTARNDLPLITATDSNNLKSEVENQSSALRFEPNVGQVADPSVRYLARVGAYTLLLTDSGATMLLSQPDTLNSKLKTQNSKLSLQLVGTTQPSFVAEQRLVGVSNYFIGNDPAAWRTSVPQYGEVRVQGVYPGVDMRWYGVGRQLEYDFILAAGADPSVIRLQVAGATVAQQGDMLAINTATGTLYQHAPHIYQQTKQGLQAISGGYVLAGNQISFHLAAYDHAAPLVIDPQLTYSSYFGASGGIENGLGIARDTAGDMYLVGYTQAANFYTTTNAYQITLRGTQDAFISKLSPDGQTLLFSTYLGGAGIEEVRAVAVDGAGNVYVTGYTTSANFPLQNPFQPNYGGNTDAFVAKLSSDGTSLLYSSYLGGSQLENGHGLRLDASDTAYVTGWTASGNFTTTVGALQTSYGGGLYDGFLAKVSSSGGLSYASYLGGNSDDRGEDIALDRNSNIYVTGVTTSTNYYTTSNAIQSGPSGNGDAFVTMLNPPASVVSYSTYLGGNGYDRASQIAVDNSGAMYLSGWSNSTNFYTTTGALQPDYAGGTADIFATKINPNGAAAYSTYLGGSSLDLSYAMTLDAAGHAYILGYTQSFDFPLQDPIQPIFHGGNDITISELSPDGGSLIYSTFFGGSNGDVGFGIVVDAAGTVYIIGQTNSANFPTLNPFQVNLSGSNFDAAVVIIANPSPTPSPTSTPTITPTPTNTTTATDTPLPTDIPTMTNTPLPTNTPTMTDTPLPTNTPAPTDTPGGPSPTATNVPSDTPLPSNTATAQPTGQPTNTALPSITPTDCPNPFVDITGNVFYPAIHYLYCNGVVSGTDSTHFSPGLTATRGQVAKIVALGFGIPLITPASQSFTDVPPSYYAYVYIESDKAATVLGGYDAAGCAALGAVFPCYLPERNITRAELTRLVVRAADPPRSTPASGPTFVDVPQSYWAYPYIETSYARGYIRGVDATHFQPARNVRRDELCQVIYKGIVAPLWLGIRSRLNLPPCRGHFVLLGH